MGEGFFDLDHDRSVLIRLFRQDFIYCPASLQLDLILLIFLPDHFLRVFKRETGFTPHEYVINTRLSNARYLLRNTAMSVKDICFSCGFSSESAFCITFKKRAKMTPAQYRQNGT